jgi:ribose transport system substrate-binding protein
VGGEGNLANMDLIRQGTQDVSIGIPSQWLGYAAADALNRAFAGQATKVDSGLGFLIIDKDHNLPAQGQLWAPPVDFADAYRKAWAGGGA